MRDPYRPRVPGVTNWSALLPMAPNGVPKQSECLVWSKQSLPIAGRLTRDQALSAWDSFDSRANRRQLDTVGPLAAAIPALLAMTAAPSARMSRRVLLRSVLAMGLACLLPRVAFASRDVQMASDNFTRADNTDLGASWDTYAGMAALQIVSNKVRPSTLSNDNVESYNAVALPNDQWASISIGTWSGTANYRNLHAGVRFATPDTLNGYTAYADNGGASGGVRIIIGEFTAGSFANLSEVASSIAVSDTLQVTAIGTDLAAYKNGALITSATDASLTGGRAAMCSYPETALTDGEISAFAAGRFSGIGGLLLSGAGR